MKRTLHLVSDSTGETVANVAAAARALYDTVDVEEKLHVFVRSRADVDAAIEQIEALETVNDSVMRIRMESLG